MLQLILLSFTITMTLVIYLIISYASNKKGYINRIKNYADIQETDRKKEPKKDIKAGLNIIGSKVSKLSIFGNYKNKIQKELIKAHILLKGEEFITISIFSFFSAITISTLIFRNILIGSIFGIFGWILPSIIVKRKKKKRVRVLNDQLSDAIVLISNSLKAGYSFLQAVEMVSREMVPPVSEEFAQLQKEINLGYTTEQALENVIKRVESDDLGLVITAVLTQRQIGGNLAEILDNISGTIRDRLKIKGEIRTLTAQGKASGMVISLVPVGLGIVMEVTNPEYIGLLFSHKLGWAILAVAVLMQTVGIYSISKIIKIEV